MICIAGLAAPSVYVEATCHGHSTQIDYRPLVAPQHHRPETRTLMTYPEWYIVHAYDDYARVIGKKDPHHFAYLQAIGGFWSSLCSLTELSSAHGKIDTATKQMVYVIGTSFTVELLLKAVYEETLGRLFAGLRGPTRAPLDDVSARQAADYATFLQQVPWYKWRFRDDAKELAARATGRLRDKERRIALGIEYGAKAAYARVVAGAVARVGEDDLTLRMIVQDVLPVRLNAITDVTIIATHPEGLEIETPRYRALTHILNNLAAENANFVEIAGNDDILFTAISGDPTIEGAIYSSARQGAKDYRHLVLVKVSDLAENLRLLAQQGLHLEHIHDY